MSSPRLIAHNLASNGEFLAILAASLTAYAAGVVGEDPPLELHLDDDRAGHLEGPQLARGRAPRGRECSRRPEPGERGQRHGEDDVRRVQRGGQDHRRDGQRGTAHPASEAARGTGASPPGWAATPGPGASARARRKAKSRAVGSRSWTVFRQRWIIWASGRHDTRGL